MPVYAVVERRLAFGDVACGSSYRLDVGDRKAFLGMLLCYWQTERLRCCITKCYQRISAIETNLTPKPLAAAHLAHQALLHLTAAGAHGH